MKYLILLCLFILSNAGCAFVGGGAIGDVEYTSPNQEGAQRRYEMLKSDLTTRQSARVGAKPFKLSDIESEWGVPHTVVTQDSKKTVTYRNGLRWNGIISLFLLPLPIAIPVGYSTVNFHFKEDILINWTIRDEHYCMSYVGFNLIPLDAQGKTLGLASETSCEWHKNMTPYNGSMVCDVPFYDQCYPPSPPSPGRGSNLK